MNKTLHTKLTEKHHYNHTPSLVYAKGDGISANVSGGSGRFMASLEQEVKILQEAAKDLLQPRPQAIAKLLQMAREI
jgi:hypothetical protein